MKTYIPKPGEVTQKWHLVDASDLVVGRMATHVATILQGKHRPTYTPFMDTGDFVVIVNADKAKFTGKKLEQRYHRYHTGYIGHLKERSLADLMEKKPELVLRLAIRRMLPKTKLGKKMLTKLKIYRGAEHPHAAQNPEPLALSL